MTHPAPGTLLTNIVRNIRFADHIIALDSAGTIVEQGSYEDLVAGGGYLQSLETQDWHGSLVDLSKGDNGFHASSGTLIPVASSDDSRRTGDLTVYKYYIDTIGWSTWLIFVVLCALFVFGLIFPRTYLRMPRMISADVFRNLD
jgi:ATP-binding cassette subfamily C (CFTR/MRP) protein 1